MSPMAALAARVWSSLKTQTLLKLPSVCILRICCAVELTCAAKFTGYQYGGRSLGITFVKYLNAGPGPDAMEGGFDAPAGITQDQIM